MNNCIAPISEQDFENYYLLRWQVLRQPWQQAQGSEKDELEDVSFHRLIKNDQGDIIAIGRLHQTSQFQAQIRYMAVAPENQRQGLGVQIITALEQLAISIGVTEITLNAREGAISFYKALGYNLGEYSHTLYDQVEHFQMSKALSRTENAVWCYADELQQTWHATIPMSKAMNLSIAACDEQQVVCHCDLAFNKNLHQTMFAGSVYTLATLTGWGWVYLMLQKAGLEGDIVLANADIRYRAPLAGVGYAKTSQTLCEGDLTDLAQGKRSRLKITVQVCCGDKQVAEFSGKYVVLPKKEK